MEVKNCKIVNSFYCIWFEKGRFHIEDVDFQKIISLSKTQLEWFIVSTSALVKEPDWKFFSKFGRDETGFTKLSKFRSPSGWCLRCVARSSSGIQSFIHIYSGEDRKGWISFLNMIRSFSLTHSTLQLEVGHSSQRVSYLPQTRLSYADKVKHSKTKNLHSVSCSEKQSMASFPKNPIHSFKKKKL